MSAYHWQQVLDLQTRDRGEALLRRLRQEEVSTVTDHYQAWGSVRGACGHKHPTPEAALRCVREDAETCRTLPGGDCYSDRSAYRVREDGTREPVDLGEDDDEWAHEDLADLEADDGEGTRWRVTSKRSGACMGTYSGSTPAEAVASMHRDAGYRVSVEGGALVFADAEDAELCGGMEAWTVEPVEPVDLDPEPPADDVDIEALAQALYLSDAARVAAEDALRFADRDDVTLCVREVELVERLTGIANLTVPDLREALPLALELEDADHAEGAAA